MPSEQHDLLVAEVGVGVGVRAVGVSVAQQQNQTGLRGACDEKWWDVLVQLAKSEFKPEPQLSD